MFSIRLLHVDPSSKCQSKGNLFFFIFYLMEGYFPALQKKQLLYTQFCICYSLYFYFAGYAASKMSVLLAMLLYENGINGIYMGPLAD